MSTALGEVGLTPADAETLSAADLVSFALERFSPKIAIASSFGAEDVVLIHLAAQARQGFRVFTLDTDFLFRQTYELIDNIERRYQIKVERTRPRLSPKEQAAEFGEALWSRQPDQCCNIRKVEPLTQKLSELDAWITGIRRDQAQHAVEFAVLEENALTPQRLVILKDSLDAAKGVLRTLNRDRIGYQVDAHTESVLHQSQIFVAGPEQGLKIGRDLEMFSHQARKKPPGVARCGPRS